MLSNRSHDWWIHKPRDFEWIRHPPHIVATDPAVEYYTWRFYADDNADPDSCTALQAERSSHTTTPGTPFMFRTAIDETAGKNYNSRHSFQYNLNGAGWNNITGSSSVIRATGGTPADDAATDASNLSAPAAGTRLDGEYDESVGATASLSVGKDQYVECQICLAIQSADVNDGDKIYLRAITPDVAAYTDSGTNESRIGVDKSVVDPVWDQDSFRVYYPGTESGSSPKRAANTDWSQRTQTRFHIRFLVQETAGANGSPTLTLRLESNKEAGGWNAVTAASSNVKMEADGDLTEGGDTTQRIGSGTFLSNNNWVEDNDGVTAASGAFAGNDEAEALFSCYIVDADVTDGDTIDLRVTENGTVLDTYTNTPTITVIKGTEILTDDLTLTENQDRDLVNDRDITDTLTLTENFARTGVWTRLITQALSLTDTVVADVTKLTEIGRFVRRLFWR